MIPRQVVLFISASIIVLLGAMFLPSQSEAQSVFSCTNIQLSGFTFFQQRISFQFENTNTTPTELNQVLLTWRVPVSYPGMYLSAQAWNSEALWLGERHTIPFDIPTELTGDELTQFTGVDRSLAAGATSVWEAVFLNAGSNLADVLVPQDFYGTTFYFSNPDTGVDCVMEYQPLQPGCTAGVGDAAALVEAITFANNKAGPDTIELGANCTYTLTEVYDDTEGSNGLPSITSEITINGNGATIARSMIDGTLEFRLFYIAAGATLTLNDISISYGRLAAVRNMGSLYLNRSSITYSYGGFGGAIDNSGVLYVDASVLADNEAAYGGGAFSNNINGTIYITSSLVTNNTATNGGGIYNGLGTVYLFNSTISNNQANSSGGIENTNTSTLVVVSSTISDNNASIQGGGLRSYASSTASVYGTIIAGNTAPSLADCGGDTITSLGYNLVGQNGSANGCPSNGTGDIVLAGSIDTVLDLLADNGGTTLTHALQPGSPAINAGDPNFDANAYTPPMLYDQRGMDFERVVNERIDIGAYEDQTPPTCSYLTLEFIEFTTFGVVRFRVTNNAYEPIPLTDFNIAWPHPMNDLGIDYGVLSLRKISVGGLDADDFGYPGAEGTLLWRGKEDWNDGSNLGDRIPDTRPSEGSYWRSDYVFPPRSVTDLWIDFEGTSGTLDADFGLTPASFNGTWLDTGCPPPPAFGSTPAPGAVLSMEGASGTSPTTTFLVHNAGDDALTVSLQSITPGYTIANPALPIKLSSVASPLSVEVQCDSVGTTPAVGELNLQTDEDNSPIYTYVLTCVESAIPLCPDGTAGDDVLDCHVSPPTVDNPDTLVDGDLGNDTVVIFADVLVGGVFGDTSPYEWLLEAAGGDDTITNNGTVDSLISGDMILNADGGRDTITNNGMVRSGITGDSIRLSQSDITVIGGDDTITNAGTVQGFIFGDAISIADAVFGAPVVTVGVTNTPPPPTDTPEPTATPVDNGTGAGGETGFEVSLSIPVNSIGHGGNDLIVNSGIVEPSESGDGGSIFGDNVNGNGGNDTLTNHGSITGFLTGDQADGNGGNDTMTNAASGSIGLDLIGDGVGGTGGNDTILNAGTIGGTIYGDVSGGQGGSDSITNEGSVQGSLIGDEVTPLSGSSGGNDTISNSGTVNGFISGDIAEGNGGDDTITNTGSVALWVSGDDVNGNGGSDSITNTSQINGDIYGDGANGNGGSDTIINSGTVNGSILGDLVSGVPGEDTIRNTGTVDGDIYGDYVLEWNGSAWELSANGAADQITNSGTIGGAIYAEGGDDTVTLQNGTHGGDDNYLLVDGGDDFDTLVFDFTELDDALHSALIAAAYHNPASGYVVINEQTIEWRNFEDIQYDAPACVDGTPDDDVLVCAIDPLDGGNSDEVIDADLGDDDITVMDEVDVLGIHADGAADDLEPTAGDGGHDVITNHGQITDFINGDHVTGNGGNDTIINHGSVFNEVDENAGLIFGDFAEGTGGDDEINNEGTVNIIAGDYSAEGGNDTIVNNGTAESLDGDRLITFEGMHQGGNDSITNNGTVANIFGDHTIGSGGNDTIHNTNEVLGRIAGDLADGAGGDDSITNSGTIGFVIAGDEAASGGNDTITNTGTIAFDLYGDMTAESGGNDTLTNSGTIGRHMIGDMVYDLPGEDIINNSGIVVDSIYGDFVMDSVSGEPTGAGAADTIINSGTIGGAIYAEGGDDTVTLQNGTHGGDDNYLLVDGGDDFDTLVFDYIGLDETTLAALSAASPLTGTILLETQTIQWRNFEAIEYGTSPDPTPTDEPTPTQEVTPTDQATPVPTVEATPSPTDEPTPTQEPTLPPGECLPQQMPYVRPVLTWQKADDAAQLYYVILWNATAQSVAFAQGFAVSDICAGTTCTITPDEALLSFGLLDGEHQLYVQAWKGAVYEEWSLATSFTVDMLSPTLPTIAVNPNQGRPTLNWQFDPNTAWYQIYIGKDDGTLLYLNWHPVEALCCGDTCTLKPDIHPTAGTYYVFMQPWGPGGFSQDGIQGWAGPATFTLPGSAPLPPTNLQQNGTIFTWQGSSGVTWYEVWIGTLEPLATAYTGWHLAEDLGCENAEVCTLTPDGLSTATYDWFVRGWGPGGLTQGGIEGWIQGIGTP